MFGFLQRGGFLLFLISGLSAASEPQSSEIEFVRIEPGGFTMGCSAGDARCFDREKPVHSVRITKAFEIGRIEITQGQWEAVMGGNPSETKGPNLPVSNVTWIAVQEFMVKLNARQDGYKYRLPTEAEWEFAARAGSSGPYYGPLPLIAWYDANSEFQSQPAGRKQPNAWGLYDMHGNMWEWMQDWYSDSYYSSSPGSDPPGPPSGRQRTVRGGAWDDNAWFARVSNRFGVNPDFANADIGFRCVRQPAS